MLSVSGAVSTMGTPRWLAIQCKLCLFRSHAATIPVSPGQRGGLYGENRGSTGTSSVADHVRHLAADRRGSGTCWRDRHIADPWFPRATAAENRIAAELRKDHR